jgi:hypothetical protein
MQICQNIAHQTMLSAANLPVQIAGKILAKAAAAPQKKRPSENSDRSGFQFTCGGHFVSSLPRNYEH